MVTSHSIRLQKSAGNAWKLREPQDPSNLNRSVEMQECCKTQGPNHRSPSHEAIPLSTAPRGMGIARAGRHSWSSPLDFMVNSGSPYSFGLTTWQKRNGFFNCLKDGDSSYMILFPSSGIHFRPFPCQWDVPHTLLIRTVLEATWRRIPLYNELRWPDDKHNNVLSIPDKTRINQMVYSDEKRKIHLKEFSWT